MSSSDSGSIAPAAAPLPPWYPLYAVVRRTGKGAHDAQDLTQEFFARLVEKEWRDSQREKRGGGADFAPLDSVSAEERSAREPADGASAEQIYDRRWALDLLNRGLARLEAEFGAAGKAAQFAALRFSPTGEKTPLAEAAAQLGMSTGAVKAAIHRLRERCRDLIRAEIAETVETSAEVNDELRHLLKALSG